MGQSVRQKSLYIFIRLEFKLFLFASKYVKKCEEKCFRYQLESGDSAGNNSTRRRSESGLV